MDIKFCCMPVELLLACLELHILIRASFLAANSATFCCKLALVIAIRDSFLGDTTKLVYLLAKSRWTLGPDLTELCCVCCSWMQC